MIAVRTKLLKALTQDPEWMAKLDKAKTKEEAQRVLIDCAEAMGHPEWTLLLPDTVELPAPRAKSNGFFP